MHQHGRIRILVRASVAAAVALAMTATASAAAPPSPTSPQAARAAAPTATASPAIRSLAISVTGTTVTMPTTLRAGTYYVHVSTPDAVNGIQVVRPGSGLTPSSFTALWKSWYTAFNRNPPVTIKALDVAYTRWRTSATFIGGASAVKAVTGTPGGFPQYDKGRGTFAVTLAPGRYWFYASWTGDLSPTFSSSRIRQVTVVGPAERVAVPTVAVARFAYKPGLATVSLPSTLPARGFILGIGTPGSLSGLNIQRLAPGVTPAEVTDGVTCFNSGGVVAKQCFVATNNDVDGAMVSGGASALWFYQLAPGDYAVGPAGHDFFFDWYYWADNVHVVHIG